MGITEDVSRLKMSLAAAEAKAEMLDLLPTPVLQIASDYTIAYINPAGAALLGVNRQHIIGTNSHNVLRTPQCHAGQCLCQQTVTATNVVAGETILDPEGLNMPVRFTGAPVEDGRGNVVGTLVSLFDLRQERELTAEVLTFAEAVVNGDLSARANTEHFDGDARRMLQGMNAMVEAMAAPLTEMTGYVQGIARGDIPEKISREYHGHAEELRQAINQCFGTIHELLEETARTAAAIARGKLDRRADVAKYKGQWAGIARGLNDTVDRLLEPIRDIGTVIEKMAAGNFKVRVTNTYQGDYHRLKAACNELGSQLQETREAVEHLKTASIKGQLNVRSELRQCKGEFAGMIGGINEMLDAVSAPLDMMRAYIEQIATGSLPGKIIDEYKGCFHDVKNSLNGLIDYFHELSRIADAVANGDLSIRIAPRSEQDKVALSFQQMSEALRQFVAEMHSLIGAIAEGQLETRGNVALLQGDFTKVVRGVNGMLDTIIDPLTLTDAYVERIASGNIPARLTDEFPGDFDKLRHHINHCIDTVTLLLNESAAMAEAAAHGDWDRRVDLTKYDGEWATIGRGLNLTAEQVQVTIQEVGSTLHRLAAGEVEARITHDYKGDYTVLKNAGNELGEQVQGLLQELEKLNTEFANGHLEARGETQRFKGEFAAMVQYVNGILDTVSAPIQVLAKHIGHLAAGELPEKLTVQYRGDFNTIKNDLNTVCLTLNEISRFAEQIAAGNLTISLRERSNRDVVCRSLNTMQNSLRSVLLEVQRQIHAVQEGRLGIRGNVAGVNGSWRELVAGMNQVVNTFMTPFVVMTDYLNRIACGDIPDKITEDFRGEFNGIRNTLNRMIDAMSEVKAVAQEIADGNLDISVTERSEKDELMKTMREMVASVHTIAESPQTLAKGWQLPLPKETDQDGHSGLNTTLRQMVINFQAMMGEMEKSMQEIQEQNWIKSGIAELAAILQEPQNPPTLAKHLITFLVKYVKAHVGAVYLTHPRNDTIILRLTGSYAYSIRKGNTAEFALGEGLIGQAALEKESILFSELPEDYVVSSGLGRTPLRYIWVMPFLHEGELVGVIELGTAREFSEGQMAFLKHTAEHIATAFQAARGREPIQESLEAVRKRAELRQYQEDLRLRQEELESQVKALQESKNRLLEQEGELRERHGDLDTQTLSLRESEQKLQQRQQQLRLRHEELDAQAQALRESEEKLRRQQKQLKMRYEELDKQGALLQRSDQKIHQHEEQLQAQYAELKSQANALRASEQKLQRQREQMRQRYEGLESRAHTLRKSEQRVKDQRGQLRSQYEELESRAQTLREFEQRLQQQQTKLQQKDGTLAQRMQELEQQQHDIQEKQHTLEKTRQFVQEKMKELETAGYYPPEFLLSMSYKLRTSLNRLLIVSNLLAENTNRNLTEKQVEFAQTINSAVTKLLALINEVLHLSKIKAGKVEFAIENMSLRGLANYIEQNFTRLAQEKGLYLRVEIAEGLPVMIRSARQQVEQILKHLLTNAIKFTEQGHIAVRISRPAVTIQFSYRELNPENTVAIEIRDTGIGIPDGKRDVIFDPFQQGDSTVSRQYGGVGLGLSIVRGLAELLHGEVQVQSDAGKGSAFTFYLPENPEVVQESRMPALPEPRGMDQAKRSPRGGERPTRSIESSAAASRPRTRPREEQPLLDLTEEPHVESPPEPEPQLAEAHDDVTKELQQVEELLLEQQNELRMFRSKDAVLNRRKILVAGRDRGNVYTLTNVLQEKGSHVLFADNGTETLRQLQSHPEIDLVLMENVMADMDGGEVMRHIRKQPRFAKLPVIALVMKAKPDEYQHCLDAGANDYLFKPVDTDELLSLLRVWLY